MDLFEQEANLRCDIKRQGHRQCSTLEGQKDYYGDIIQKSIEKIKKAKQKFAHKIFCPPPPEFFLTPTKDV